MKFIDLLWAPRRERPVPSPSVQERIAQWVLCPPHRNVDVAPVAAPIRTEEKK